MAIAILITLIIKATVDETEIFFNNFDCGNTQNETVANNSQRNMHTQVSQLYLSFKHLFSNTKSSIQMNSVVTLEKWEKDNIFLQCLGA